MTREQMDNRGNVAGVEYHEENAPQPEPVVSVQRTSEQRARELEELGEILAESQDGNGIVELYDPVVELTGELLERFRTREMTVQQVAHLNSKIFDAVNALKPEQLIALERDFDLAERQIRDTLERQSQSVARPVASKQGGVTRRGFLGLIGVGATALGLSAATGYILGSEGRNKKEPKPNEPKDPVEDEPTCVDNAEVRELIKRQELLFSGLGRAIEEIEGLIFQNCDTFPPPPRGTDCIIFDNSEIIEGITSVAEVCFEKVADLMKSGKFLGFALLQNQGQHLLDASEALCALFKLNSFTRDDPYQRDGREIASLLHDRTGGDSLLLDRIKPFCVGDRLNAELALYKTPKMGDRTHELTRLVTDSSSAGLEGGYTGVTSRSTNFELYRGYSGGAQRTERFIAQLTSRYSYNDKGKPDCNIVLSLKELVGTDRNAVVDPRNIGDLYVVSMTMVTPEHTTYELKLNICNRGANSEEEDEEGDKFFVDGIKIELTKTEDDKKPEKWFLNLGTERVKKKQTKPGHPIREGHDGITVRVNRENTTGRTSHSANISVEVAKQMLEPLFASFIKKQE